jgi:hypothetical protein
VPDDLAREIEAEIRSERAAEQELCERRSAEWRRIQADRSVRRAFCAPSEEHLLRLEGDLIGWRPLARDDFRAREPADFEPVVDVPGSEVGAHVALHLACVGEVRVERLAPDRVEASLHGLRYLALLDREGSWWNPKPGSRTPPEWILRHEQGHFDLAELFARRLDREAAAAAAASKGSGATEAGAVDDLVRRFEAHLVSARREFEELEDRYDRETRHGTDLRRQTEWYVRIQRDLRGRAAAEPHREEGA